MIKITILLPSNKQSLCSLYLLVVQEKREREREGKKGNESGLFYDWGFVILFLLGFSFLYVQFSPIYFHIFTSSRLVLCLLGALGFLFGVHES